MQTCIVSITNDVSRKTKKTLLKEPVSKVRGLWEETSFQLELRQCNPVCVEQERLSLQAGGTPSYNLTFRTEEPKAMPVASAPKVAVIREEGTNGDRELAAAFFTAGFEVYDVTMTDLIGEVVTLDRFQGLAFAGGFAYADVLGSGKGKDLSS